MMQRLSCPPPPSSAGHTRVPGTVGLQCKRPLCLCGATVLGGEIKGLGQETQCVLRRTFSRSLLVQLKCTVPPLDPRKQTDVQICLVSQK